MSKSLAGRSVLIAEDSWILALSLKAVIETEGGTTIGPAATLSRALELLDHASVDLALVDMDLKGEDASPLLEALRAREIAALVLSGQRPPGIAADGIAFLGKPATAERLVEALNAIRLPGRGSRV